MAVRRLSPYLIEICIKYLTMQTITLSHVRNERRSIETGAILSNTIQNILARAEANRFGIVAALILIQVTIAGFNVVIPPMVGLSIWMMTPGIVLVFLANGLALAQMNMKWTLALFALSIVVNAAISIYSVVLFLN